MTDCGRSRVSVDFNNGDKLKNREIPKLYAYVVPSIFVQFVWFAANGWKMTTKTELTVGRKRKSFLSQDAPLGYVAGLGRG